MNKYQEWYSRLVNSRQMRLPIDGIYYERHHILPKSLGGDDSPQNLVWLTPREHFIAHLLLVKFVEGQHRYKMQFALNMMMVRSPDHESDRYIPGSRLYQFAREGLSEAWSECKRGKPTWNKGVPRTQAVKDAVSKANKGKVPWNKGRERTPEERQKMKDGWAARRAARIKSDRKRKVS